MTYEAGYVREGSQAPNPTAVRWWVYTSTVDGFVFARGGRCPTSRDGRALIDDALASLRVEQDAWRLRRTHELLAGSLVRRPTHRLMPDGSLEPIVPTDYEID